MLRPTYPEKRSPVDGGAPAARSPSDRRNARLPVGHQVRAYDRSFWCGYVANVLILVAVALMFRYSDFVTVLGGSAWNLGWIVGIGAIGSLAMRLTQGVGIDHFGPRKIWMLSLALVAASLLGHLLVTRVDGLMIYVLRIGYQCGLAGTFASQITYVSQRAPRARMAEVLGVLGSSGFIGMTLGSQLGDVLCANETLTRWHVDRLMLVAAIMVCASLACASLATRGQRHPTVRRRPSFWWLIRRYHPGRILLMGVVMGAGFSLPGTFVRPFTEQLDIHKIGIFFTTYAITAFVVRVTLPRLPLIIGIPATVIVGMGALSSSMLLYLIVHQAWQLLLPAFVAGFAHALLFPSVVTGGCGTFPTRHRGLGTALILGMFDLGILAGMPLAGTIVDFAPGVGLPAYTTMLLTMAGIVTVATGYYALRPRREIRRRPPRALQNLPQSSVPEAEVVDAVA